MDITAAVSQLSALAQEARLSVFRLLVRAGHDGLPAGEIAATLGIVQNTLSAQLTVLSQAGLVRSERRGRSIVYFASYETISQLIIYLMEDCCQGRSEIREPVLTATSNASCCGT
jgi:ArsR family transcriptional regulator, arsenate/arsenite/antimonite-responsive transcriptional repressor